MTILFESVGTNCRPSITVTGTDTSCRLLQIETRTLHAARLKLNPMGELHLVSKLDFLSDIRGPKWFRETSKAALEPDTIFTDATSSLVHAGTQD